MHKGLKTVWLVIKINNYQQFMNKFNKKLTISLPQDPIYTQQNQSPSVPESTQNDKYAKYDKQGIFQFRQFRDGADSQFDAKNQGQNSKLNFVQFQEFNVHSYQNKQKVKEDKVKRSPINKRNVVIEVPDRDQDPGQDRKFKQMRTTDIYLNNYEEQKFKQPPAPSKGSKINKVFVFPTTPKKQQNKQKQASQSKQELKRSFQRERQQFYKEKSRLEKQILIKNGQIEMLHKLLTENLAGTNQRSGKTSQFYNPTSSYNEIQNILLQKDLQINQLLQKISQLNNQLSRKNQDYSKKLIQVTTAQNLIQSLKNQLYIYERKDDSQKLTKKFYHYQIQKPKQQNEEQFGFGTGGKQFGSKGLENLYKRIQMVRLNRIEFDSRNKIKSDTSYSQTTKNRTKGAFDFKGKAYEPMINQNKTKIY